MKPTYDRGINAHGAKQADWERMQPILLALLAAQLTKKPLLAGAPAGWEGLSEALHYPAAGVRMAGKGKAPVPAGKFQTTGPELRAWLLGLGGKP